MTKLAKLLLYTIGGLVVIPLVLVVILLQLLDTESYRQQLAARASEAAGMNVSLTGPMDVTLFPALQIVLNELRVDRAGQDVATAKKIIVGVNLLPLFRKELEINSITLQDPVVTIARLEDGSFGFEKPARYDGTLPTLDLESIAVRNGVIYFHDIFAGAEYEATACNIHVADLVLRETRREDMLKHLRLAAELGCGEVKKDAVTLNDVKVIATGSDGQFTIEPVTATVFGAAGSASVGADFTAASPAYTGRYSLPQFQAEAFLAAFFPQQTITGKMDFVADLAMRGVTREDLKQSLSGTLSLRGTALTLHGIDLDEELAEFESTQNFTLIDVGAVFFAGPLGLAVTKGYDYASLFQKSDSNSAITRLVSDWTVVNGVAEPMDVAMATDENLMAVQGGLDFYNNRFDDMTVALLDAAGCASVQQVVRGSFADPEIEKPGFLMALAAPAISLIKQGVELLPGDGEECEPFYTGSLLRSQ